MKGITFGDVHSFTDLRLILASKEIGSPEVKTSKIDIEGADGSLDLSDYFGGVKYGSVTHKFDFSTTAPQTQFLSQFSNVKNKLHGKKVRIILDDDPTFYYIGRLTVSPFTSDKGIGNISIEANCDPYKYKIAKTVVTQAISGTTSIVLTNGRKKAVPTITASAAMTVSFGEFTWSVNSGTFVMPELELSEGINTITAIGTGTIKFEWQEGEL